MRRVVSEALSVLLLLLSTAAGSPEAARADAVHRAPGLRAGGGALAVPLEGGARVPPADTVTAADTARAPRPAAGEQGAASSTDTAGVSPDSAAVLRRRLERPPATPATDWVDVVAFPFRVATLPLALFTEATSAVLDRVTAPGPPSPLVVALRDVKAWGLKPGVGSVGPRSGPAGRLHLDRFAPLHLATTVSVRGSQRHRAWFRLPEPNPRLVLGGQFRRWAEPHFWGVGPDAPEGNLTDFRWDQARAGAELRPVSGEWIRLGLDAGWQKNWVDGGLDGSVPDIEEAFAPDELFGLGEPTEFVRLGGSAVLDFTDRPLFQPRGVRAGARSGFYVGTGGTESDFHQVRAHVSGFLPVNGRQLLVLRGKTTISRRDDGRGVPFTHLAYMGDEWGSRAYTEGRFRDRDLAAGSAEWRYELWRDTRETLRLESFLFFEEAAVSHELSEIESGDWRPSYGGGLRLVNRAGPLGAFYVADGDLGTRVQLEAQVGL